MPEIKPDHSHARISKVLMEEAMNQNQAPCFHPCPDEHGQPVILHAPSTPTPPGCWHDPQAIATAIPQCAMPEILYGVPFTPWDDAPVILTEWQQVSGQFPDLQEPEIPVTPLKLAAGAIIEEVDGRIWLVAPSNQFRGCITTFPKGQLTPGLSLQATAIKEVFEESGLRIVITGHFLDAPRSETFTRYYTGRRIGGTPAAMHWESQAVHLVPKTRLLELLNRPGDQQVVSVFC